MSNAALAELVALSERLDRSLDASLARLAEADAARPDVSFTIAADALESVERPFLGRASSFAPSSFNFRA